MQDRSRIDRDKDNDYEFEQQQREVEDGDKAPRRSTVDEHGGRGEGDVTGGKGLRMEGRKEGFTREEDEILLGRDAAIEEEAEEDEMLNVES